jgi:hypothetical protein
MKNKRKSSKQPKINKAVAVVAIIIILAYFLTRVWM